MTFVAFVSAIVVAGLTDYEFVRACQGQWPFYDYLWPPIAIGVIFPLIVFDIVLYVQKSNKRKVIIKVKAAKLERLLGDKNLDRTKIRTDLNLISEIIHNIKGSIRQSGEVEEPIRVSEKFLGHLREHSTVKNNELTIQDIQGIDEIRKGLQEFSETVRKEFDKKSLISIVKRLLPIEWRWKNKLQQISKKIDYLIASMQS